MDKKIIALILVISIVIPLFSGCLGGKGGVNDSPIVEITYPYDGKIVSSIVMISGTASDPDGDDTLDCVEVMIDDSGEWLSAEGTTKWSFDWNVYDLESGLYNIKVRASDSFLYSEIDEITVRVDNPESVESNSHKWALFVACANFPEDNESKLGNGGLNLAEEMTKYLVERCDYPTSNIIVLFDDGWIRSDNGFGERVQTLQERHHEYDITYGGASKHNLVSAVDYIAKASNEFDDSEVFIWLFSHGAGEENERAGGKILETSKIFLWNSELVDNELGDILYGIKSKETCVIIDACYSGGFADKTIYNLPTLFLLRSTIPKPGRVVISGASKYRVGYTSTTNGPLFSMIWFEGIKTGVADGFRPGIFDMGRPTKLKMFKDGKVSVEEAFYYARYVLENDESFKDYNRMEPQINDRYPGRILNSKGLIFG